MKKLLALMYIVLAGLTNAQIPQTISFQGILTDTSGVPKADGIYLITFKLYEDSSAVSSVWSEEKNVQTNNGLFYTELGSVVPLSPSVAFNIPYYLGITISGEAELSPRIPLTSTAYSFTSLHSFSSSHADTAIISLTSASDTLWSAAENNIFRLTGNIGIGTSLPQARLDVSGKIISDEVEIKGLTKAGSLELSSSAGTGRFLFSSDDFGRAAWSDEIHQVNGLIGIGLENPSAKLDVNGLVKGTGFQISNNAADGKFLVSNSTGIGRWSDNLVYIGNNLGIGVENPAGRLHVVQNPSGFNPTQVRTAVLENSGNVNFSLRTSASANLSIYFERGIGEPGAVLTSRNDGDLRMGRFMFTSNNASSASYFFHLDVQTGNIGLGREPLANDLELSGNASKSIAGDWLANSDRRIKTDVTEIDNAFELLLKLHPVKFKYTGEWKKRNPSIEEHFYYNFIAQEFQEVFPESVKGSGEFLKNDPEEILQLDSYNAQIITIKAAQELVIENQKLKSEIEELRNKLDIIYNKLFQKKNYSAGN